jgi:hypothetical protein
LRLAITLTRDYALAIPLSGIVFLNSTAGDEPKTPWLALSEKPAVILSRSGERPRMPKQQEARCLVGPPTNPEISALIRPPSCSNLKMKSAQLLFVSGPCSAVNNIVLAARIERARKHSERGYDV